MQSRATSAFLFSSIVAAASILGGCIIVGPGTDNSGGFGGSGLSGGSGGFSSSISTSSTGTAGSGGMGGSGGTGGMGGGSGCVALDVSDTDVNACDAMNITPAPNGPAAQCIDPNTQLAVDPPGYLVCKRGYQIYMPGAADNLQGCLAQIGVEPSNACSTQLMADCVAAMYLAICANQSATDACNAIATQLCINGEVFDTANCLKETNPLNATALQDLLDKITNSADQDCNIAYDKAFAEITSY